MKCPICGAPTRVLSTRRETMRRRECDKGHRFTTEEVMQADIDELHDQVAENKQMRDYINREAPRA